MAVEYVHWSLHGQTTPNEITATSHTTAHGSNGKTKEMYRGKKSERKKICIDENEQTKATKDAFYTLLQ